MRPSARKFNHGLLLEDNKSSYDNSKGSNRYIEQRKRYWFVDEKHQWKLQKNHAALLMLLNFRGAARSRLKRHDNQPPWQDKRKQQQQPNSTMDSLADIF
jgi:hypothetical protein